MLQPRIFPIPHVAVLNAANIKVHRVTDAILLRGHTKNLPAARVKTFLLQEHVGEVVCVAPRDDAALRIALIGSGLTYTHMPFADGDKIPIHQLEILAKRLADDIKAGGKVLLHCNAGRNRSALLAGLILLRLGFTGTGAVALIREKRPGALANRTFATYLECS